MAGSDTSPDHASKRRPIKAFRNVAYAAAATTFILIFMGGVVRVSDSGLGCGPAGAGTSGWPLCGGGVVPGIDTNMLIEYSHRILAAIATALILLLVVIAWRNFRDRPQIFRTTLAAFGLILIQASLGGLVVEEGLKEELVATHLGIAMLQIGLLLLIARFASQATAESPPVSTSAPKPIRVVSIAATVALFATIVAGGYMSAIHLRGTTPAMAESVPLDAHMACGSEFPSCNGGFMPFGQNTALDIHLTHRTFMYISVGLIVALFAMVMARRRQLEAPLASRLTRWASILLAMLFVQVLLGALNVWLGEHEWLIVAHLIAGTALWSCLMAFDFNALGLSLRRPVTKRNEARAEAVPA